MEKQTISAGAPSAEAVVQRQLEAYNARNLEALLATYAEEAEQFGFPDQLLTRGADQLRERARARFSEPNLYARLIHRAVMGDIVIDQEVVTRTFPEGPGTLELVAIYQVQNGKIAKAWFIPGRKTLDTPGDS
jgi:hypothetical protein